MRHLAWSWPKQLFKKDIIAFFRITEKLFIGYHFRVSMSRLIIARVAKIIRHRQ